MRRAPRALLRRPCSEDQCLRSARNPLGGGAQISTLPHRRAHHSLAKFWLFIHHGTGGKKLIIHKKALHSTHSPSASLLGGSTSTICPKSTRRRSLNLNPSSHKMENAHKWWKCVCFGLCVFFQSNIYNMSEKCGIPRLEVAASYVLGTPAKGWKPNMKVWYSEQKVRSVASKWPSWCTPMAKVLSGST